MSVCINNENYLSIKVLKADVYVCVNIYNNYKIVPPNFIKKKINNIYLSGVGQP